MGSFGPQTVSGEGHTPLDQVFGFTVAAAEVWMHVVTTNQKVRFIGAMPPRGCYKFGSFGLGFWPDDESAQDPPVIGPTWFVQHEAMYLNVPGNQMGFAYYGSIWWRLLEGCSISLEVLW